MTGDNFTGTRIGSQVGSLQLEFHDRKFTKIFALAKIARREQWRVVWCYSDMEIFYIGLAVVAIGILMRASNVYQSTKWLHDNGDTPQNRNAMALRFRRRRRLALTVILIGFILIAVGSVMW